MSEQLNRSIKIQGLSRGLILGSILTAISIIYFYFTIGAGAIQIAVGFVLFPYILPIIAAALLCFNLRKKIGGYWTLRQATTGIFIMFVIANLTIFILRDQIFARTIEPNMTQKTETAILNALNKRKEATSNPEEKKQADEKIKEIKKGFNTDKNITIGQQILFLGFNIIFLFVSAIAFASFFKREPQGLPSGS